MVFVGEQASKEQHEEEPPLLKKQMFPRINDSLQQQREEACKQNDLIKDDARSTMELFEYVSVAWDNELEKSSKR